MSVDLDDTRGCPVAARCITCAATADLGVQTADTPLGVICLTVCDSCADGGRLPRFGMAECVTWSLDHCGHLGITADDMAALMTPTDHTVRHYG